MKARRISLLLLLGLLVGAAEGRAQADVDPEQIRAEEREFARRSFAPLDADADGRVPLADFPAGVRIYMRTSDLDGDGVLTLDEYQAFLDDASGGSRMTMPENVELREDIPYAGTRHPRQTLDVFLPRQRAMDEPLPVIAYIHGGAWRQGSKLMARPQVAAHVASGRYAAVAIGYRLSWQATWPAQSFDLKAGLRWIHANAEELGLDPQRICAMGASAGGHLASMIGTTNGVEELEGTLGPNLAASSAVVCSIPFFGPSDLRAPSPAGRAQLTGAGPSSREQLLGARPDQLPALARQASPLTWVDASDPPFFIVHGTKDPLVPFQESVNLDRELKKVGVESHLLVIEGGGHGDFFSPEITRRVGIFLDRILYARDVAVPTDTIVYSRAE